MERNAQAWALPDWHVEPALDRRIGKTNPYFEFYRLTNHQILRPMVLHITGEAGRGIKRFIF